MNSRPRSRESHAQVAEGHAPLVLGRLRVLHVDGALVYASHGLDVHVSRDGGRSFTLLGRAWRTAASRALALTPIASRLLRAGVHALVPLFDGGHVAVVRGAILRREVFGARFEVTHEVARGTRPLNVCADGEGVLFFGEYFGNPARDEVHVYGSEDGRAWDVAYTFPRKTIRHVHAVVHDPYRHGLWVLTGDDADEAGVWWTADRFRTLEPVARGFQGARAVMALPTPRGLIVPSDAPDEPNFIQRLDPRTGRMERLAAVPGSVFSAGRTHRLYLVSTALEPSAVNLDPRVALFGSVDGEDWRPVARFERDLAPLNDIRGRLQYPMVLLPSGTQSDGGVLATGQALRGLHGRLLRWDEGQLVGALSAQAPALRAAA